MRKIFRFILLLVIVLLSCSALLLITKQNDKTYIKFSSWGSQTETAIIKELISEYEQTHPQTKIEFVHIPQNYFQKLHLLFASNLAPDVVFLNNYYAPKYVKANLLLDLTQYIDTNLFFDKSIDAFTFDKKIYAFPRDVSELIVYYNKDMFSKNGIPFPSHDWSISEYKNIAKSLTKDTNADGKNDIWGTSFETDPLFWLPFLMSNGVSILSEDKRALNISSPTVLKIINEYSDMANKDNIAPTKSQSASLTMAQLFLQQKIAMHVSGRWLVPKYREQANFDWDIALFPAGKSGSIMNIDASGYAISKSSKHKQEALEFIKFMTSKKSIDKLSQSGLIVPALKETALSENFLTKDKKPKHSYYFIETVINGKATPVNENYQVITDKLNRVLEPVFLGQKKSEDIKPSDFDIEE